MSGSWGILRQTKYYKILIIGRFKFQYPKERRAKTHVVREYKKVQFIAYQGDCFKVSMDESIGEYRVIAKLYYDKRRDKLIEWVEEDCPISL